VDEFFVHPFHRFLVLDDPLLDQRSQEKGFGEPAGKILKRKASTFSYVRYHLAAQRTSLEKNPRHRTDVLAAEVDGESTGNVCPPKYTVAHGGSELPSDFFGSEAARCGNSYYVLPPKVDVRKAY
jgi:hypothetical protein